MGMWKVLHIGKEDRLPGWLYRLVSHSDVYESTDTIEEGLKKLKEQKFDLVIIGIDRFHDAVKHKIREIALASNPNVDIIYAKQIQSSSGGMGFYYNASQVEDVAFNSKFWGIAETQDFLSLIEGVGMTSHTASLTIISGNSTGVIYFRTGNVVHAEVNGIKGKEAFTEMVSWKGGIYFVEEGMEPPEVTIDSSIDSLLLEIISKIEERNNPYDKFIKILMMELPADIRWGIVVREGEIVSRVGENIDETVVKHVKGFMDRLADVIGEVSHANLECEDYWVTARRLTSDTFVMVAFQGNPFIVDYVLAKNLEKYGVPAAEIIESSSPMELPFEELEEPG